MTFENNSGLPPMPVTGRDKPEEKAAEEVVATPEAVIEAPALVESAAEKRKENIDRVMDFYTNEVRDVLAQYLQVSNILSENKDGQDERQKRAALMKAVESVSALKRMSYDMVRSDEDMPTGHILRYVYTWTDALLSRSLLDAPDARHSSAGLDDEALSKIPAGRSDWEATRSEVMRFQGRMEGAQLMRGSL